jgi:segregation and condensation protein A
MNLVAEKSRPDFRQLFPDATLVGRRTAISETFDFETIYQVKLDKFEGPLELLLHLIKKNELDIYDIPISIITKQYLEYIKLMKELNLEIAGEFLVMASTLLHIKSQMLLPSQSIEDPSLEEEDPRAELIRRLLEYQKYKEAGQILEVMDQTGRDLFVCKLADPEQDELCNEEEVIEIELFELIEAFRSVLSGIPVEKFHEVHTEMISIADRINDILTQLQEKDGLRFEELFSDNRTREDLIASFLAILELGKRKLIRITQIGLFREIWITPAVPVEETGAISEDEITYV